MPTFVHPALLWGMLIVGVPVLIHLINMFRHRRVPWAAMEFLAVSRRRNRTWVLLKQLLLLLMRITAVAAIVLMLARPYLPSQWGNLLDGRRIHHIVLLDDSYSMTDRRGGERAFDQAKAAAGRIAAEAARQPRSRTYSLIRFSEAAAESGKPDLLGESVRGDFLTRLADRLQEAEPSETAAGPVAALGAIERWLGDDSAERRIVYLLTDFRDRHWQEPEKLKASLHKFQKSGTVFHLVQCVQREQPNVGIASINVGEGIRAAGVPFFVDIEVVNHSDLPLTDVVVRIEADGAAQPAVRIPRIPPRETVAERFSLQFAMAGQHVVTAETEADAVAVDNRRYCVVDVPADLPVLLIDGGIEATEAGYLSAAMRPGGSVATGLSPVIERPRYLSQHPLDPFCSIYLLNIERLKDSAVKALESYVAQGGGLGIFLGPNCSTPFYNENLYRSGQGVFPLPLVGPQSLPVDRLEKAPDLNVTAHPMFRIFAGKRNSFLSTVTVSRYFAVPEPLPEDVATSVKVIASLRNGAPLAVERSFGQGRVVAFLTTAGPVWNNWARGNPSYVVAMLELQAHLSRHALTTKAYLVGESLRVELDPSVSAARTRWVPPETKGLDSVTTEVVVDGDGMAVAPFEATGVSGVYQAEAAGKDGSLSVRRFAVNVDPSEGNLDIADGPSLAATLDGIDFRYEPVTTFRYAEEEFAGTDLSDPLLFLLVILLVLEQIVAYWVGDHPSGSGAKGGAV